MSTKEDVMSAKPKMLELKFTRTIPATPAEVFGAWLDPTHPGNPWTGAKKVIIDARVDGLFFFATAKDPSWPHYGRFLAVERNRRVQYAWMSPFTNGLESTVTVTFEKKGDDTLLTLTHAGLPDDDHGRLHEDGWNGCLGTFVGELGARAKG
ncbi:MAG TPA: SRPBCC domain-containing protein [Polyangia bacterium]|nr:SRPBCC domain-containing protein [Polyangia bacterium]